MYARQLNPIHFVGGRGRRRQAVGAEFFTCPDGSQVKNDAAGRALCGPPPSTSIPNWGPGPALPGPTTPTYTPPGPVTTPTYTPPGGYGGPGPTTPVITTPSGCRPVCNPCPEDLKRYYMPFVPQAGYTASVTAGSLVIFVGRPQKLFAPDRLIIGSTIGAYFDIVSLTIANIPQSLSAGNVGAEMFSEVATYVMMTFDQAYPGIDIILTAQNKSSVTQTFQAQLVGEAVG